MVTDNVGNGNSELAHGAFYRVHISLQIYKCAQQWNVYVERHTTADVWPGKLLDLEIMEDAYMTIWLKLYVCVLYFPVYSMVVRFLLFDMTQVVAQAYLSMSKYV